MDNKPKTMDKGAIIASYEPVVDIIALSQEFSGEQPIQSILENLEGLNEDQRTAQQKLLQEFRKLFFTCYTDVGHCNVTQHKINTGDHPPIKQYPRRLPIARKEEADLQSVSTASSGSFRVYFPFIAHTLTMQERETFLRLPVKEDSETTEDRDTLCSYSYSS
ncbi:retrovirus-related Pol polyprotein from transposon 297 [Nephila pilipes]|uniref:Retrovirus-related Pol polyprotein from transposon 297 n=1 Tax=Nephila pilipes TaxID=299642 RepID=A0A8X6PZE0_NEPPI|nr:retrovirus-related Pol polyprotein from transposon 297 [Nephila pilipes]